jgi:phosphate transport system permease protein
MSTAPTPGPALVRRALRRRRADWKGRLFEAALLATLLISLLILLTLVTEVMRGSTAVFAERSVGDFVSSQLSANPEVAGVRQALLGSLYLMIFTALISFPLGIGAAIYLEEYAPDTRFTRLVNSNIRNLAGVPSIVFGLLGLSLFVKAAGALTGPQVEGRSVISGGLTLGVLVLPIVIIVTAEALRAVPETIREAAFGVGATPWQVIRHHVLPVAAPGIFTGIILSLGRAFGEAAPLLMVGGITTFFSSGGAGWFEQLRGRFSALPVIIFRWASLPQEEFRHLTSAAIVVMLVLLLAVNATAIILRNRYERQG